MTLRHSYGVVLISALSAALCSLVRADDTPAGTKIEAEAAVASDSVVIDDANASGGKAVENAHAWHPLIKLAPPATGERFAVYVRHRGGPLLVKSVTDAGQKDVKGIWAKPADWTWTNLGVIDRAKWGTELLILRGGGDAAIAIDAIVIGDAAAADSGPALPTDVKTDSIGTLPPEAGDTSLPAIDQPLAIDWAADHGTVAPELFGIADYEVHDPKAAADEQYNAIMAQTAPPLIRIHRGSFPQEWLTADQKQWDLPKIKACLAAAKGYGNAKVMLNLASWPKWMQDPATGVLAEQNEDEYVALCVELMRLFRDELHHKVDLWEVFNEHDGGPMKRGAYPTVLRQYTKTVRALKAFDPQAKVGGFAFTWANPEWVMPFAEGEALAVSDFVTYHNYGIGSVSDSNEKLFGVLNLFEKNARLIRETIDKNAPGRHVPIFLDEYNVKWVWNPLERRHANAVGAAFQAGVLCRIAAVGIDGATVWHFKGNAYGVIDSNNKPRLTQPLFEWAPRLMSGTRVTVEPAVSDAIETLAVRQGGGRSVLIVNKSPATVRLPAPLQWIGEKANACSVSAAGRQDAAPIDTAKPLELPGYSFFIVSIP